MADVTDYHDYEFRRAKALAMLNQYSRYRADYKDPQTPSTFFLKISGVIGVGGVNSRYVERALANHPGAKSVEIVIDSPGGEIYEARKIYALLRRFKGLVSARVVGRCESAAVTVLLAAGSREAVSDAKFHPSD